VRIISPDAQAALASGRFRRRHLLRADLDDGPFALWDDVGNITLDGITYHGAAGRFSISDPMSVSDMTARNMDVAFSGLDQDVYNTMMTGAWHQRPVAVWRLTLAEDQPNVLRRMPVFAGAIDQMLRRDLTTTTIVFRCESSARELDRRGVRTRGDADQRARDATDRFFEFAAASGQQPLEWGRRPINQIAQPQKKKFFGLF